MPDERRPPRPDYKVYRSQRGPLAKLRPGERLGGLPRSGRRPSRDGGERRAGREGWSTPRKVITAIAALLIGWVLLSIVLFFVSAQTTNGVSEKAEKALSDGGSLLTGSTILVLGSDERPGDVETVSGEGGRADSILLLHVGFGSVRRLSILRDSLAEIPGHGTQRINAAYALGGPALMIDTVESFLGNGLEINHLIEVNFHNFPDLIDALGGVDVDNKSKICSPVFDSNIQGELNLPKGEQHLDGDTALSYARVRTNPCAPGEDDRARAARQQQVLSGMRDQLLSPWSFVRLPWISWEAPQSIKSDLKGPGLAMLFTDLLTGGTGKTRVLQPDEASLNFGGGLNIPPQTKADAVAELLGEE